MSSSDKCELVSEQLMCELANLPNASHLKKGGKMAVMACINC